MNAEDGHGAHNKKKDEDGDKKLQYPLVQMSELPYEDEAEIIELISATLEKHSGDVRKSCESIKIDLDKKFGNYWNVIIGEAYGFKVSYLTSNILYMFILGNLGVLIWKCC